MTTASRPPILLFLAGIVVRIPMLFMPLTYGHEVWRQADTASVAHHFLTNGYRLLYPQIFWGGNGPGYVETEFQLYPFLVALLYGLFGEHLWLGRVVSLLFSFGAAVAFWSLAKKLLSEKEALWALALFLLSPLNIRYGIAYMPEAALICFYIVGINALVVWGDRHESKDLFIMAGSFALAFLVKATVIHAGLIVLILALRSGGTKDLLDIRLWLAGIGALIPGAAWYVHARRLYLEYGNTFGILSGGDTKFGGLTYWLNPDFYLSTFKLEVVWVFGGIGVLLFALGFFGGRRRERVSLVWIGYGVILLYYLIVARYAGVGWGVHYHLYAVPFAALGASIGLSWLLEKTNKVAGRLIIGIVLIAVAASTVRVYHQMLGEDGNWAGNRLVACAEAVASIVPDDAFIIVGSSSPDNDNGNPNNFQDPTIFFYAKRYGWSLPSNKYTPEAIEQYRAQGAQYFVVTDSSFFRSQRPLVEYIQTHAKSVGGKIPVACEIFQLNIIGYKAGENLH